MPIILDFSHIYEEENLNVSRLDLSSIMQTNMFCSNEAADIIRNKLKDVKVEDIHFLDNGNYHYLSYFFLEKITYPFSLVLFDHHTDMQDSTIRGFLSCGNWVKYALNKIPNLKQVILIGQTIYNVDDRRVIYLSYNNLKQILKLPTYISIDKDVLSQKYAITNWNQGEMSLDLLEVLLKDIFKKEKVIGIDICGECSMSLTLPELIYDENVNSETNLKLLDYLKELAKEKGSVK